MGMIKHSQSTQSSKFAISLPYHKKEVENIVHFLHADKHQSFYKLALSFLMKIAKHVQSSQNRKLAIFVQYVKKQVFLHSTVIQNIQILYRYYMYPDTYLFISLPETNVGPLTKRQSHSPDVHCYINTVYMISIH